MPKKEERWLSPPRFQEDFAFRPGAGFGGSILCQKDSFLCAARGIEIGLAFTKKLGAGLFGGEGFILQRLQGNGLAFIHAGGHSAGEDLKLGELLKVDTGCLAALAPAVDYDIQFVGGFKNALLGGEVFS